jgi:N-acetylmuramoyl-L-alanine amidase
MAAAFTAKGPCSWFGGPNDDGVDEDEGLAFIYDYDQRPDLFLDEQPPGTTGLARRLNPNKPYVACRWDYALTPKEMLADKRYMAVVRAKGRAMSAWPSDWGPHEDTGRVADLSPSLMEMLGLSTDDEVEVSYPIDVETRMQVALSSGHGRHVRGASGVVDEVAEARKVVETVERKLREKGIECAAFHDNESDDQSENLDRIVKWHNSQIRDFDVSVHFNAYEPTENPMGTEVLYATQSNLASVMSDAMATAGGLLNRGGKYRADLYFLNKTDQPAILIEVCFVDSTADVDSYHENFDAICQAIADTLENA